MIPFSQEKLDFFLKELIDEDGTIKIPLLKHYASIPESTSTICIKTNSTHLTKQYDISSHSLENDDLVWRSDILFKRIVNRKRKREEMNTIHPQVDRVWNFPPLAPNESQESQESQEAQELEMYSPPKSQYFTQFSNPTKRRFMEDFKDGEYIEDIIHSSTEELKNKIHNLLPYKEQKIHNKSIANTSINHSMDKILDKSLNISVNSTEKLVHNIRSKAKPKLKAINNYLKTKSNSKMNIDYKYIPNYSPKSNFSSSQQSNELEKSFHEDSYSEEIDEFTFRSNSSFDKLNHKSNHHTIDANHTNEANNINGLNEILKTKENLNQNLNTKLHYSTISRSKWISPQISIKQKIQFANDTEDEINQSKFMIYSQQYTEREPPSIPDVDSCISESGPEIDLDIFDIY